MSITCTPNNSFKILTDAEISSGIYAFDNPGDYNASNIASVNNILRKHTKRIR